MGVYLPILKQDWLQNPYYIKSANDLFFLLFNFTLEVETLADLLFEGFYGPIGFNWNGQ